MKNIIIRFRWVGILLGILLIAAGIVVVAMSIYDLINEKNIATNVLAITAASICFIIGAAFIVAGILIPLSNFFDSSFAFGAISIAAGVVLLVFLGKDIIPEIIIYLVAVALIAFGAIYLVRGILMIVNKLPVIKIVLAFVIATIGIAAGIVSIVMREKILYVVYIIIGLLVITAGTIELITLLKNKRESIE